MSIGLAKRVWRRAASPLLVLLDQSNEMLATVQRLEDQLGKVNHRVAHLEEQNAELDRALEVLMASGIATQRDFIRGLAALQPKS